MESLARVEDIVMDVLLENKAARNSDHFLYIEVIKKVNPEALHEPFERVLSCFSDYGLPRLETVGRLRRKAQERYPDLRGCDQVKTWRKENERNIKEYVKE